MTLELVEFFAKVGSVVVVEANAAAEAANELRFDFVDDDDDDDNDDDDNIARVLSSRNPNGCLRPLLLAPPPLLPPPLPPATMVRC